MKTTLTVFTLLCVFIFNTYAHSDSDVGRKQLDKLKKEFIKKGWRSKTC